MTIVPKPYPQEFRDDVVKVAQSRPEGTTLEQIAADFGIHPMTLSKWLRVAAVATRAPLWLALGFLYLIAAAFLISNTFARLRSVVHPGADTDSEPADGLAGTPFEHLPQPPRRGALSATERALTQRLLDSAAQPNRTDAWSRDTESLFQLAQCAGSLAEACAVADAHPDLVARLGAFRGRRVPPAGTVAPAPSHP